MKKLQDKVAIITGSRRGIGKGIALAFAKEGCKVVISDYVEDKDGKKTVEEIKRLGSDAIFVKADVSKEKDVKNLVGKAVKKFGKLSIMVNIYDLIPVFLCQSVGCAKRNYSCIVHHYAKLPEFFDCFAH